MAATTFQISVVNGIVPPWTAKPANKYLCIYRELKEVVPGVKRK